MDWTSLHGVFLEAANPLIWVIVTLVALLTLGYFGLPFVIWAVVIAALLCFWGAPVALVVAFVAISLVFIIRPLRAAIVSRLVIALFEKLKFLPKISETERTALEAGKVWIEKDLFSGKPNFKKIMSTTEYPKLSADEQSFIDNQVEKLCAMVDDWDFWESRSLPQEVWDFVKKEKFLGMIIPKEYGGLGFTALGHSEVIMKVSSRSIPLGVNIMVPNSLGPAELLIEFGTEEQKRKYLPRLANGDEIPCFALTEPTAGSDAGSITSYGILFKDSDGQLKVRLNWNKRWITLAAVSTLLGLAFRLRDPDNILGKGEDVGITCALIPTTTPGVIIGRRHDPLGAPFYNCPTQGKDVIIPVDQLIGGIEMAGKGWGMLMESLGAGRGISLPAQSAAGGKAAAQIAGAHSVIRRQFGVSIGKFEGVEEPLARIGASAYLLEACRRFTAGAIDSGVKPPVVTAIAKLNATEIMRKVVNDAMDILGGAGISRGPRNTMAHAYTAAPISITVEGANIMTRTLIVFGQGALRAHPYAYAEVKALEAGDVKGFDRAFWGHIGHVVSNLCRSIVLSLTRGRLAAAPGGPTRRYYQKLSWTSATFAILADIAMGSLGGALKMREKITGRFADILSWMYLSTATLRRWEAEGRLKEDLIYVDFIMQHAFNQIQAGFDGLFANLKVPLLTWLFRGPIKAWSSLNTLGGAPNDKVSHKVAQSLQKETEQRHRIIDGIYSPSDVNEAVGRLENAFRLSLESQEIERKIRKAIRSKQLPKRPIPAVIEQAVEQNVISRQEAETIAAAEKARYDAIQVDDFSPEEYFRANRPKQAQNKMAAVYTAQSSSVSESMPVYRASSGE